MIAKLRGRSLAELRGRLAQQVRALAERRGILPTVDVPVGMPLTPATPWPVPDTAQVRALMPAAECEALIARAERVVMGRFDVLGLHGLSYGSPVNWHRDPLSGREAARSHWSRVPYLDHERVGDHKVTWELNRHQWFVMLGQAWVLTGDARYASTAARLLREWLEANPPKHGINWVSALELSFRVQSWIHGLRLFDGALAFDVPLRRALVASAALQVDHVTRNLSTWFSPNTHLTGEALAILMAGCAWPGLPHANRWRTGGWKILCDELDRQVRPDGVYFEQSAWYQAYTLDFYTLGIAFALQAGLQVPESMPGRVRDMARALRTVTRPDGTIARLGDDDGGRILSLTTAPFGDLTDSLWRAAVWLNDETLAPPGDSGRSALLWLEGADAYTCSAGLTAPASARTSRVLRDGGWVALTDPHAEATDDHWLVLDAGPHGARTHAHSHADALGIDLSVGGLPMLVDPGTGAYVGETRRRYRSTAVHNTVTVDGVDSSEQGASFNWRSVTNTQLGGFGSAAGARFVTASHDGYHRLADPVRHQRTILRIDRSYWLMLDTLDANSTHQVALTFQAAPEAHVAHRDTNTFVLERGRVRLHITPDPRLHSAIEMRRVSPAYALEVPATAILSSLETVGRTVLCTAFGADDESGPLAIHHDGRHAWRIVHRGGTDLVACPAGESMALGPAQFDGGVLLVRHADDPHTVVAAGAGTLHLAGRQYSLRADDIRVAHRAPDGTWTMES